MERYSTSLLGSGVPPAGLGWGPARRSASRMDGGGGGAGGGGRHAIQPPGWVASSLLAARNGAQLAARSRGWASTALVPAVEGGDVPPTGQTIAYGALIGLMAWEW
jgi:hypothetical protein